MHALSLEERSATFCLHEHATSWDAQIGWVDTCVAQRALRHGGRRHKARRESQSAAHLVLCVDVIVDLLEAPYPMSVRGIAWRARRRQAEMPETQPQT